MTNKTRELFDFAQLEPDSTGDMFEMLKDLSTEEICHAEKVSGAVLNAIRSHKATRSLAGENTNTKL